MLKGIDPILNADVLNAHGVKWSSRVQYAANRSKVTKLVTPGDTLIYGYLNAVVVGQPVGEFYGAYYPRDAQGHVLVYDDLPAAYRANVDTADAPFNRHVGDPAPLTAQDIRDIVAFLHTLDDGWRAPATGRPNG